MSYKKIFTKNTTELNKLNGILHVTVETCSDGTMSGSATQSVTTC